MKPRFATCRVRSRPDSLVSDAQIRAFNRRRTPGVARGSQIGPAVYVRQWWVPVLWDGEEDPTFVKESCIVRETPS